MSTRSALHFDQPLTSTAGGQWKITTTTTTGNSTSTDWIVPQGTFPQQPVQPGQFQPVNPDFTLRETAIGDLVREQKMNFLMDVLRELMTDKKILDEWYLTNSGKLLHDCEAAGKTGISSSRLDRAPGFVEKDQKNCNSCRTEVPDNVWTVWRLADL